MKAKLKAYQRWQRSDTSAGFGSETIKKTSWRPAKQLILAQQALKRSSNDALAKRNRGNRSSISESNAENLIAENEKAALSSESSS